MREDLKKIFGKSRMIRIDNVMHVFVGAGDKADALVKKALNSGKKVTENGVSQWVSKVEVFDSSKSGSAAYIWKGDKIKVERFLVTKDKDGNVTKKSIGFGWSEMD